MKTDSCKIVAIVVIIGSIGSMIGWYWQEFLGSLSQSVQDVKFGPAVLWLVLAALFIRVFNKLVFKD